MAEVEAAPGAAAASGAAGSALSAATDEELIARFVGRRAERGDGDERGGGDRAAFEVLVRRHLPAARRFLALRLSDPAEAEEAEQEVLVRLFTSLPRFRGESTFRTWLFRVCSLAAADLARSRARERSRRLFLARAAPPEESRASDEPSWAVERSESAQAVRRALAALGEPAASLVYLRDAEGLSIEELAGAFALREGTVKSKLARGRERLRELIEREGRRAPRRFP